jgi:hypothetical protein
VAGQDVALMQQACWLAGLPFAQTLGQTSGVSSGGGVDQSGMDFRP